MNDLNDLGIFFDTDNKGRRVCFHRYEPRVGTLHSVVDNIACIIQDDGVETFFPYQDVVFLD